MEIAIIKHSDVDFSNFSYNLILKKWTPRQMEVQINFTEPLLISRGVVWDELAVIIKNKTLFRSPDGL